MVEAVTATGAEDEPLEALIARGARREALTRLTRDHGTGLARLCFVLLGDSGEAEEVAQEALLAAYDGMDGFRADASARAWLYGIGRRMCARRLVRRGRRERRLRLVTPGSGEPMPDEVAEARRTGARVRAALDALRPTDREALVLRYRGELTYREIATALGIDEAAARKRTSRALVRLRTALGEER